MYIYIYTYIYTIFYIRIFSYIGKHCSDEPENKCRGCFPDQRSKRNRRDTACIAFSISILIQTDI